MKRQALINPKIFTNERLSLLNELYDYINIFIAKEVRDELWLLRFYGPVRRLGANLAEANSGQSKADFISK